MNAARAAISLALLLYPSDFRSQFRTQIESDIAESRTPLGAALADIVASGIALRFEALARDLRYAVRRLAQNPLFSAIVAITFALGIGANVAVFSVLNTVLLKPLPYPNADRVVVFRIHNPARLGLGGALSIPNLNDIAAQTKTLQNVGASTFDGQTWTGYGKPRALDGAAVTSAYFPALGIKPQLGRFFTKADERPGAAPVVLSDALWRSRFAADASVLGRTLIFNGTHYHVIGVAPRGLLFPESQIGGLQKLDYYVVQADTAPANQRGAAYLGAIAELKPGVSLAAANADLARISKMLQKYPVNAGDVYSAVPLADVLLGPFAPTLWMVFIAVIAVVIITCANVANMLLAAASSRDREFAMRAAIGASKRRIVSQLITETRLLALGGGIIGIGLAYFSLQVLRASLSAFPRASSLTIDPATLLYALGVVVLATFAAGLWPSLTLAGTDLQSNLKTSDRSGRSLPRNRARSVFVVIEMSMAVALVILSGLMARSFFTITHTDVGVQTNGLFVSDVVGLPTPKYEAPAVRGEFERRLLEGLRAIPGVNDAAISVAYPLANVGVSFTFSILGQKAPPGREPQAAQNNVSTQYFATVGIPLLHGRLFTDADNVSSMPVAIVNETFARMFARGRQPIGMRIRTAGWNGNKSTVRTVVGVVADARSRRLTQPADPTYFVPVKQAPPDFFSLELRSNQSDAPALSREVETVFGRVDSAMAAPAMEPYASVMSDASKQAQSAAILLGALAIVALLLALSGVFGVVSLSVTQRYHEFGVRRALGARAPALIIDVLRRAIAITGFGVAIGVVIAAFSARAIASQLYGVAALDPATFIGVIALLVLCALIAAVVPAIRSTRIDPAASLRYE